MIYIFHRAEGFYPIALGGDSEAIANAHSNPGTLKVTDSENRVVFDSAPGSFDAALNKFDKETQYDHKH